MLPSPLTSNRHACLWLAVVLAAFGCVVWALPQWDFQDLLYAQSQLTAVFHAHPVWVTLVYFVVFTSLTALCLPGASVLMLAGGACMGLGLCTVVSTAASALGALFTFLASRHWLRQVFERRFGAGLQALNQGLQGRPVATLLSLRLAPIIPFVALNALAGLTQVPARTFVWTSFVGMLPGTLLYVHAGHRMAQVGQPQDILTWQVCAALLALAVVPWICRGLLLRWGLLPPATDQGFGNPRK